MVSSHSNSLLTILLLISWRSKLLNAKMEKSLLRSYSKLPKKADYSSMLEKITRLAYKSGFDIKSLEPKDFSTKNGYQSMEISMDISTRYSNLLDFLSELHPYPIYLQDINITVRERPLLKVNLNLYILFR